MNDLDLSRLEAVNELAAALFEVAGDAMTRHGNDPQSYAILAAGFSSALIQIGKKVNPVILQAVKELLKDE